MVAKLHRCHRGWTGGVGRANQLAGGCLSQASRNQQPGPLYCDFAIWLPYGRRTSKTQKTRTYTPLGDGTFLYRDIPGPRSFQAWKVVKGAALMLNIVNLAALELCFKQVEKLVTQYPQCWSLIRTAEDTARAERLEKIRRQLDIDGGRGRQVPEDWDPTNPWSCLFRELVKDAAFWSEKAHHPAAAWIAAGSRGAPKVASESEVLAHLPGMEAKREAELRDSTSGKRLSNREKREPVKKRIKAEREELRTCREGNRNSGEGREFQGPVGNPALLFVGIGNGRMRQTTSMTRLDYFLANSPFQ